jgi:hypothetical protein
MGHVFIRMGHNQPNHFDPDRFSRFERYKSPAKFTYIGRETAAVDADAVGSGLARGCVLLRLIPLKCREGSRRGDGRLPVPDRHDSAFSIGAR